MRVISILLLLTAAGAALTGGDGRRGLVGLALMGVPEHQPQIHSGRQRDDPGQLPIPGMADWYLAAHHRGGELAIYVEMCQLCYMKNGFACHLSHIFLVFF